MSDSDSAFVIPVLSKETVFSDWKSDAKAYLRRKSVYGHCLVKSSKPEDLAEVEKCAGILWGLLGPDVKPLVKQHNDDPKALWDAVESIFAPRKAGAHLTC